MYNKFNVNVTNKRNRMLSLQNNNYFCIKLQTLKGKNACYN